MSPNDVMQVQSTLKSPGWAILVREFRREAYEQIQNDLRNARVLRQMHRVQAFIRAVEGLINLAERYGEPDAVAEAEAEAKEKAND